MFFIFSSLSSSSPNSNTADMLDLSDRRPDRSRGMSSSMFTESLSEPSSFSPSSICIIYRSTGHVLPLAELTLRSPPMPGDISWPPDNTNSSLGIDSCFTSVAVVGATLLDDGLLNDVILFEMTSDLDCSIYLAHYYCCLAY